MTAPAAFEVDTISISAPAVSVKLHACEHVVERVAGGFDNDVIDAVHEIVVGAGAAGQGVIAGAAVEQVEAGAAVQVVPARPARRSSPPPPPSTFMPTLP